MPADFSPELPPEAKNNPKENKIEENEEKKEKITLCYTAIKTQFCVNSNLSFSESLATAYFRISENKDEKIFLLGNVFLAKLAKAIFEKNENLFVETCETHKDENYFLECTKALEEQGFVFEKRDYVNRDSWLGLFKTVLLLTEEYLSTKCELPNLKVLECKENDESSNDLKIIFAPQNTSEEQLKDATLLPLEPVLCSSDFLYVEATFFDFLNKNFPYQNNEKELTEFLKKIFDENVCKNLYPMPIPESIRTGIMETGKLGAYKHKKIYISHRLALDSLRDPTARFILLLAMLHEYGHFLDDILHEQAGITGDSEGEEGKNFAYKFMGYSPANLLNTDFKFADLSAPNQKVEYQTFSLEISNLSYEKRKEILCLFDYSQDLENGSLRLPNGDIADDVEFFGSAIKGMMNKGDNFANATHQKLTQIGAEHSGIKFIQELEDGSIWPDFPSEKPLVINRSHAILVLSETYSVSETDIVYKSHFGENQYWHSMCPKLKKIPTNSEVRDIILKQCEEWYSKAQEFRQNNKLKESLFELGKLCHMLQDSFVLAHCWRRYVGDEKFIKEDKIEKEDNGKIWAFQDYECQDGNSHSFADSPTQINKTETIGYRSAEKATEQIMLRYSHNLKWHEKYSTLSSPKDYLSKVYELCSGRENLPSGGSHPWFKKNSDLSLNQLKDYLTKLSMEVENA
jgi:hypothetical protein